MEQHLELAKGKGIDLYPLNNWGYQPNITFDLVEKEKTSTAKKGDIACFVNPTLEA